MTIHVSPVVLQIREYKNNVDVNKPLYKMNEPYDYVMVIVINDDGVGRLMGLDGKMTHKDRRILAVKLKGYGVRRVEWKHNGKQHYLDLERDLHV